MRVADDIRDRPSRSFTGVEPSAYFQRGFLDPIPFLGADRRRLLLNHLTLDEKVRPMTWPKGQAVNDRLIYDVASDPALIGVLRRLIGENIVLWGAHPIERVPGQKHPWHVDMESAAGDQRFASVWIGLRDTCRETGLTLISRSHAFPKTIQEVQHDKGVRRGEAADDVVLGWARELDPTAEIVQPDIADGDALIFDGRVWHGSHNQSEAGARLALVLQYANTDAPVFMPDLSHLEWPFKMVTSQRPPVIVVSGAGNGGGNRQVNQPPTSPVDAMELATVVQPLALPLPLPEGKTGWRPQHLFRGLSDVHDFIGCHASVLAPGRMPHLPHAHIEEEILIVLDGEAELLIGSSPSLDDAKAHAVRPHQFVYYPAYQHHTLRNAGAGPLSYLMFKWRGSPLETDTILPTQIIDIPDSLPKSKNAFQAQRLFEGQTNFLGKFHAHYSQVQPGGGYEPHSDDYDVAIVVLSGTIETLGRKVEPFGVVYYAAHELHGLRNVGSEPAKYLVFEFHGESSEGARREKLRGKAVAPKKTIRKRIKKLIRAPIRMFTRRK